jgi:hypothetical protein
MADNLLYYGDNLDILTGRQGSGLGHAPSLLGGLSQ